MQSSENLVATKEAASEPVPERFDPLTMAGELTEAEHLSRYQWAAQFVEGSRVLDAGCGTAYGSALLSRAGAARVLGVDLAEAVIEASRGELGDEVELAVGDLRELAEPADAFDVVVCFEVIEHVDQPERVLAELARVLTPGGLLVISSPNRDAYVPGNPHHVHEFLPDELRTLLETYFGEVRLYRQQGWVTVGVLDDATFAARGETLSNPTIHKLAMGELDRETFTVALASDAPLPKAAPVFALTGLVEVRRWLEHYNEQQEILHRQNRHMANLERNLAELQALRSQLHESEQRLGPMAGYELEAKAAEKDRLELDQLRTRLEELEELVAGNEERYSRVLTEMKTSLSWRITAPLRALKRWSSDGA